MSNDIGTIIMRMPNGKKSAIVVTLGPKGTVDILVQRSSEGEALIRLPAETAGKLGEHLATASALSCGRAGGNCQCQQAAECIMPGERNQT